MKFIFTLAFLSSLLVGCSTVKKFTTPKDYHSGIHLDHQELMGQRLTARTGHDGFLVNQICKHFDQNGKCDGEISVIRYNISENSVREKLINFGFACKIGGKRYRLCRDQPGFCRQEQGCVEWKKKLITRKTYCAKQGVVTSDYIPVERYEYLIDGATECRAGY